MSHIDNATRDTIEQLLKEGHSVFLNEKQEIFTTESYAKARGIPYRKVETLEEAEGAEAKSKPSVKGKTKEEKPKEEKPSEDKPSEVKGEGEKKETKGEGEPRPDNLKS